MAAGSERIIRSRSRPSAVPQKRVLRGSQLTGHTDETSEHRATAGIQFPAIRAPDIRILRQKQAKLRTTAKTSTEISSTIQNGLSSTLIFTNYEAGTAICIDPAGWVLTCAHCFGDDEAEIRANMPGHRWLLLYTGQAVLTECRAWDTRRDLALLKIIAVEGDIGATEATAPLRYVSLSTNERMYRVVVVCIGQPGADDLESATARKTKYNLFEISTGKLRGLVPRIDPQDNSEIGALKHDAWTYWGHSGAPLLREDDGTLVGVHSSWDDKTTMRHAIPLVAIREFLKENLPASKIPEDIKTILVAGQQS